MQILEPISYEHSKPTLKISSLCLAQLRAHTHTHAHRVWGGSSQGENTAFERLVVQIQMLYLAWLQCRFQNKAFAIFEVMRKTEWIFCLGYSLVFSFSSVEECVGVLIPSSYYSLQHSRHGVGEGVSPFPCMSSLPGSSYFAFGAPGTLPSAQLNKVHTIYRTAFRAAYNVGLHQLLG